MAHIVKDVCVQSRVRLCSTLWTVARQAPLSIGFSGQEYWSGSPFPPPADLSDAGIEPASLTSPELAGGFFTTRGPWETPKVKGSICVAHRGQQVVLVAGGGCLGSPGPQSPATTRGQRGSPSFPPVKDQQEGISD